MSVRSYNWVSYMKKKIWHVNMFVHFTCTSSIAHAYEQAITRKIDLGFNILDIIFLLILYFPLNYSLNFLNPSPIMFSWFCIDKHIEIGWSMYEMRYFLFNLCIIKIQQEYYLPFSLCFHVHDTIPCRLRQRKMTLN